MEPFDPGQIVGVRQILDAPPEDLLAAVAEDVAFPLVDAKQSTLEIELADVDTGVLERHSEPFLGVVGDLVGSAADHRGDCGDGRGA
jgi:hypothetical protein